MENELFTVQQLGTICTFPLNTWSLSLNTIHILDLVILCGGGTLLCPVGFQADSLTSAH